MKFKDLIKSFINNQDEIIDSDDVYTFYLIHKPSNSVIHHCTNLYPTRKVAQWSAVNFYNWFLQDTYNQDDIVIGISKGIPEILNSDNVRQNL